MYDEVIVEIMSKKHTDFILIDFKVYSRSHANKIKIIKMVYNNKLRKLYEENNHNSSYICI